MALLCQLASAGQQWNVDAYDAHVNVTVTSWLKETPPSGMIPLTLRVLNGSSADVSGTITARCNNYGTGNVFASFPYSVKAGQGGAVTYFFPLPNEANTSGYYHNVSVEVNGSAIKNSHAGNLNPPSSIHSGSGNLTPFIAMGTTLGSKLWRPLGDAIEKGPNRLLGCEVEVAGSPEDWRGYASLAQYWLGDGEWATLAVTQKSAVMDWVSLGGRLVICGDDPVEKLAQAFPGKTLVKDVINHGLGEVKFFTAPLELLKRSNMGGDLGDYACFASDKGVLRKLDDYNPSSWEMASELGKVKLNALLIFLFILVFGIIVGPVNLFVFARGYQRHRLFWTTPLISLVGSGLLMLLMIVQDGFGGKGSRLSLAVVMPEEKRLALVQEQVSRTGVLLGRSFKSVESQWTVPLQFKNSSYSSRSRDTSSYSLNDDTWSGDWFQSRQMQGQMIETVRSHRGTVEFTPDEKAPTVVNSLPVALKRLFVRDSSGRIWEGSNVSTGQKVTLKASAITNLLLWKKDNLDKRSGAVIRSLSRDLTDGSGWFLAEAESGAKLSVPTLSGVTWSDDRAFITGRLPVTPNK